MFKTIFQSKAQIVYVFDKYLPRSKIYTVEFVGESRAPMQVKATRLNECTLSVQAPGTIYLCFPSLFYLLCFTYLFLNLLFPHIVQILVIFFVPF